MCLLCFYFVVWLVLFSRFVVLFHSNCFPFILFYYFDCFFLLRDRKGVDPDGRGRVERNWEEGGVRIHSMEKNIFMKRKIQSMIIPSFGFVC